VVVSAVALTVVAFSAAAFSPDNWTPGTGWTLVWADKFEGASINPAHWTYDVGSGGWGNHELQTYTSSPANAYVQNFELVIEAIKSRGKYTCGFGPRVVGIDDDGAGA
jgi:beta-glucanase (GH16 family)